MDKSLLSPLPEGKHTSPKPLYEQVKAYVLENIQSDNWPVHSQIPSEHTMVRDLKMSRMTIHRALRELTKDGFLERIQGVGTFVARPKEEKTALKLADIKDTIERKNGVHKCEIKFLQAEPIETDMAAFLQLEEGVTVYRSYFIHLQNNLPVMLEDRFTNPELVPKFLKQDFSVISADGYFRDHCNLLSHSHQITALSSSAEHHHFLRLEQPTACVQIVRKSWTGKIPLSFAKYTFPANRFSLIC